MDCKTIYTLDARENVMLEVLKEYSKLSDKEIFQEINNAFLELQKILNLKNIEYKNLKTALIPNSRRHETVLVFDTTKIESSWYGLEVFKQIIPLFDKKSNHSVLCGDLIGKNEIQLKLRDELAHNLEHKKPYVYQHSTLFFLVYMNNLSDKMLSDFISGLTNYDSFIGSLNFDCASFLKTYTSFYLARSFIKHKNLVIQAHPDDVDITENENTSGYPFEELGYAFSSIPNMYFDLFLSYKIERPVFEGFDSDTLFSINSISTNPALISDLEIELNENKLIYLFENHGASLVRAGFANLSIEQTKNIIREKINSNYIFNMSFNEEFDTAKFNIIIELPSQNNNHSARILLSLEYKFDEKKIRVITIY